MTVKHAIRQTVIFGLLVLTATLSPSGQEDKQPSDRWAPVRFLIGSWEGTSEGRPGKGTVRRLYQFALRDQYIEVRNTSTYPATEKNPKGEVHEDHGFISFDRARKRFMFRQFHVEGFVIHYAQDDPPAQGAISFTSEAIENIPPGWRARESYVVLGPDEFEEIFELAAKDKPFEVYSRTRLKRIR